MVSLIIALTAQLYQSKRIRSPETGKGVDGGSWEGMMVGRKLINGVSDENNETIDSSISDNVDFYSDR